MSFVRGTSLASQAVETAGGNAYSVIFDASQGVGELAQSLQCNRDTAIALSRRIDELVTAVTMELQYCAGESVAGQTSVDHLSTILREAQVLLQEQQRTSYLSQLLYRERNMVKLNDMSQRVQNAFEVVMLRANSELHNSVTRALEKSLARASNGLPGRASEAVDARIPPAPQMYFGRADETHTIADMLSADVPAHIAILGGPGMGKTALATAVLHEPAVAARFRVRRFFVACDAADTQSSCIGLICSSLGVAARSRKAAEKSLAAVLGDGPCLLVLDNFESAWEAPSTRSDAEDVLAFLSAIEGLSLLVTMRGAERPHGVVWTKPLLPPVQPLDDAAAIQLFLSICDISDRDEHLAQLLAYLDNVPLAVLLAANVAQYESTAVLMRRWSETTTAMLKRGDGSHRLNSLDVSIAVSLAAPRMSQEPDACVLLGLLSLLPQGAADPDVRLWASDFRDPARALSAVLRTALAFRAPDGRVKVLAPIREFVLAHQPPTPAALVGVYSHYFGLADLVRQEGRSFAAPDAITAIAPEVENIDSVIRYALQHAENPEPALKAVVCMLVLLHSTGTGSMDVLPSALSAARKAGLNDVTADLLYYWGYLAFDFSVAGEPQVLWAEARALYERASNVGGLIDTSIILANFLPAERAAQECSAMRDLAGARGDTKREIKCLQQLAFAYERLGWTAHASAVYSRAVDVLRPLGESEYRLLGYNLLRLGNLSVGDGRVAAGLAQLEEAAATFQAAHAPRGVGGARALLGQLLLARGDVPAAVSHLEGALAAFRAGGGTGGFQALCLQLLTAAHLAADDLGTAEDAVQRARRLVDERGADVETRERIKVLQATGELAHWRGDYGEARAALDSAVLLCRGSDTLVSAEELLSMEEEVLLPRGRLELSQGNCEAAFAWFLVAALISRKQSTQTHAAAALALLAQAASDGVAKVLLEAVLKPLYRFGFRPLIAESYLHSARIAARRHQLMTARHRALRALRYFEETKNPRGCSKSTAFLAEIC